MWNGLTIKDQSEWMRFFTQHKIYDLKKMKLLYDSHFGKSSGDEASSSLRSPSERGSDSYRDGGLLDKGVPRTFYNWAETIKRKRGIDVFNDSTYDYVSYYKENMAKAWEMAGGSPSSHFPDTYKTPSHPTFSNESRYSQGPQIGGSWVNDSTFQPSSVNRASYPQVYKDDRPYTEREIYGNGFAYGGDMGPDDPPIKKIPQMFYPMKTTISNRDQIGVPVSRYPQDIDRKNIIYDLGTLPTVNVSGKRLYPKGYDPEFVNDLNRIQGGILKGALKAGAVGATAGASAGFSTIWPILTGTVDGVLGTIGIAKNLKDKEYGKAAMNAGMFLSPIAIQAASVARNAKNVGSFGQLVRNNLYYNVEPAGYDNITKRGLSTLSTLLNPRGVDIDHPIRSKDYGKNLSIYLAPNIKNREQILRDAREDAWRTYLKMEPKNGYLIKTGKVKVKNPRGEGMIEVDNYTYNTKKIQEVSEDTWTPNYYDHQYDILGGIGGGVSSRPMSDEFFGVYPRDNGEPGDVVMEIRRMQDLFDLQPFQDHRLSLANRFERMMRLKNEKYKLGYNIGKAVLDSKPMRKVQDRLTDFEVSDVVHGNPFAVTTDYLDYQKLNDIPDFMTEGQRAAFKKKLSEQSVLKVPSVNSSTRDQLLQNYMKNTENDKRFLPKETFDDLQKDYDYDNNIEVNNERALDYQSFIEHKEELKKKVKEEAFIDFLEDLYMESPKNN